MSLRFRKCHDVHAIAEFQAIVRFVQPLEATEFLSIGETVGSVANSLNLPARVASPSVAFQFGDAFGNKFVPQQINPMSVSTGFQRFAANGEIAERLGADLASVAYVTQDYKGWETTRATLHNSLGLVAAEYTRRSSLIANVLIQYTNDFTSNEPGFVPASEIFRTATKWISSVTAGLNDYWHSHVGLFLPGDERSKNLVNVNVDVAPHQGGGTQAKLLIVASRHFAVENGAPLALTASETPEALLAIFDQAHNLEKQVLNEVLSDKYLREVKAL